MTIKELIHLLQCEDDLNKTVCIITDPRWGSKFPEAREIQQVRSLKNENRVFLLD